MRKSEIILLICAVIQTLFIALDYFGIKPNQNWPSYITKIFEFLLIKIPLIWCLISVTIATLLVLLFSRKKTMIPTDSQKNKESDSLPIPAKEKIGEKKDTSEELTKEETYILAFLIRKDESSLTVEEMLKNTDSSNIRMRNAIDKLERKSLIERYDPHNPFGSESYILTKSGRELVVNLGWDEKLKNL